MTNVIIVNTGFGYITEKATGNITSKAELPKGEHNLDEDYEYTEVASKAALDAVETYREPEEVI